MKNGEGKRGGIKRQIFVKWERKMANNVNYEEMEFLIRNLVYVEDPPRKRRQKFLLMRLELCRYFPKEEGMMQHSYGRYFPQ